LDELEKELELLAEGYAVSSPPLSPEQLIQGTRGLFIAISALLMPYLWCPPLVTQ
jgi:hypothetical protein